MKSILLGIAFAVWANLNGAFAQSYPSKPIRLIVPFPPGGGADIVGRLLAQKLTESFGQPVVVENRAGAGGNIATEAMAKAEPDGYTIGVASPGPITMVALYPKLPYDPARDLAPVSLTYESPILLVAHPSLPARNAAELVALAKSRPGKLNAALSGNGSIQHLLVEMLKDAGKIRFESITYKGGAPAAADVVGGQVDFTFSVIPIVMPHISAGKLKALAVASDKRTPLLPAVPTMVEAGLPTVVASNWNGIVAPAGTPRNIIDVLNAAIGRSLQAPDVKERFVTLGLTALGGTPDEFGRFLRADTEKWTGVIKNLNVKIE